jgi:YHS domain-containing protein
MMVGAVRTTVAATLLLTVWVAPSMAQNGPPPFCTDCTMGVVMGGADVVGYWSAVPGSTVAALGTADHSRVYQNATFWFQSAANAETFVANPTKYVPAWGGFCAYGVAREGTNGNPSKKAEPGWPWSATHMGPPCDPHDGWALINGTLFCAIHRATMDQFITFAASGISDGNIRWTNWYGSLNAGPYNTGCWPGVDLPECVQPGRDFPNRTAVTSVETW